MTTAFVALAVLSLIGSEWATPLNTLLLVILALISARNGRRLKATNTAVQDTQSVVENTHAEVLKTHVSATHAAEAASSAASAALDAARVAKDVGGALRQTATPPPPPATGVDGV